MEKSKGKEGCKEEFIKTEEDFQKEPSQKKDKEKDREDKDKDRGNKERERKDKDREDKDRENQDKDSLGARVVHNLLCVSRLHRKKVESALAQTELHGSQHRLLMFLSKNDNISQTKLAKEMEVSSATIAVALKKLEKGGYIRKVMDEADNRYNKIAITEKGEQVILESLQIFRQTDKEFFGSLTKEELEQLNQYLIRMKGR